MDTPTDLSTNHNQASSATSHSKSTTSSRRSLFTPSKCSLVFLSDHSLTNHSTKHQRSNTGHRRLSCPPSSYHKRRPRSISTIDTTSSLRVNNTSSHRVNKSTGSSNSPSITTSRPLLSECKSQHDTTKSGLSSSFVSRGTSSTAFSFPPSSDGISRPISQISDPALPTQALYNNDPAPSPLLSPTPVFDIKTVALMHLKKSFRSRNSISRASSVVSDPEPARSPQELRQIFYSAIRLVLIVVKLCNSIRKYIDKPETLKELNHYSRQYEFSANALVFSKSYYSKSSSSSIPLWARSIMSMDPSKRTFANVQKLCSLLRKLKKFRDWFSEERQIEFCRYCQYTSIDKRRVIQRAGDKGYFCYLIFSGSVFVNVQETDEVSGIKYNKTTTVLSEGSVFGDSSLILDIPHDVTLVTRDDTELLVLDRYACLKILPAETNRQAEVVLNHIRQSQLLSDWPINALRQLSQRSELLKYPYNAVIESDTMNSEFIYMIVEGVIEVITTFDEQSLRGTTLHTPVPDEDDPFCETALYERLKSPNQCSSYRVSSPQGTGGSTYKTVLFSLELLHPYCVCDLRSLLPVSGTSHRLSLISHTTTVIRIPKLKLKTTPPNRCWRQLLVKARDTPRYPSATVLFKIYEEHLQWSYFKSAIVKNILDVKNGKTIVNKSVQLKGVVSGWNMTSRYLLLDESLNYRNCLGSSVPLYRHSEVPDAHEGLCINNYQPIFTQCNNYLHKYYWYNM